VITDVGPGRDTDPELNPLTVQGVALGAGRTALGQRRYRPAQRRRRRSSTLTIISNGSYTYAVNNANTTVQGLRTSARRCRTSSATRSMTAGRTTTQVTITIRSRNNPVAGDDLGISATRPGTNNGTAGVFKAAASDQ
jgi:VCBS repeat-containing protein